MSCPQFSYFSLNIRTQPAELVCFSYYHNNFITRYLFHLFITSLEGLLNLKIPREDFVLRTQSVCSTAVLVYQYGLVSQMWIHDRLFRHILHRCSLLSSSAPVQNYWSSFLTYTITLEGDSVLDEGGADKSLARSGKKTSYSNQTRDLRNILPTKLNTLLSPLLSSEILHSESFGRGDTLCHHSIDCCFVSGP
jgi:hypothetical protein